MTDCAHDDCTQEAVGSVLWETGSMRNYCETHLQSCRDDLAEYIDTVDLL